MSTTTTTSSMKTQDNQHTTNYFNTLIEVADDCKVSTGQIPSMRNGIKTIAYMQFELIFKNPYKYTSDELLFQVFADKHDLTEIEYEAAREQFFSKGQACLRASPLAKQLGWGIHFDKDGKVALYARETDTYQQLVNDSKIKNVKALRTSRK